VEDRGFQFADGVYEVVYLHRARLIDRDLHLDRLERSLRELRIAPPIGRAALLAVLGEIARRNRLADGLIYCQVTRGGAPREFPFPPAGTRPSLVVTARRTPPLPASPDGWTASAITAPDQRWARRDIKSVSLLPNVLARQAAREAGAAEAILFDQDGMVTEGAATSVWMVDGDGVLRTRPLSHAILPGCTRAALAARLAQAGIALEERAFSVQALRDAREVFLTAASSFVKPVLRLDGAAVGDGKVGPVSRTLFGILADHISAQA
jgi:D-alanine transaminase